MSSRPGPSQAPGPGQSPTATAQMKLKVNSQSFEDLPIVVKSALLKSPGAAGQLTLTLSREESKLIHKIREIRSDIVRKETRYCRIRKTIFQTICCILGALEAVAGNLAIMVKIIIVAPQNHATDDNSINDTSTEPIIPPDNNTLPLVIIVLDFVTFILLSLSGLILLNASGVCRKESKLMSLIHILTATLVILLLIIISALLSPHYIRGFYGFPPGSLVVYGNVFHALPLIILLPAIYFSFGLYKVIKVDEQKEREKFKFGAISKQSNITNATTITTLVKADSEMLSGGSWTIHEPI